MDVCISLIIWLGKYETGSNISNDNSRKGIPKAFDLAVD